jgi:hypothetical protein
MFSFLNTLEILPVAQVEFIARTLGESGLDAAVMLKAKVGMPGCVSVNAWTATAGPLCRTIPTQLVCCESNQSELREILLKFCEEVRTAAANRSDSSVVGSMAAPRFPNIAGRGTQ